MNKTFFAFPNRPPELTQVIDQAVKKINLSGERVKPWTAMDINGRFIDQVIKEEIQDCVFAADITFLNFNVLYEIGYAIGKGRKILLVKNNSFAEESPTLLQFGIFDTIGYTEYKNSEDLVLCLRKQKPENPTAGNVAPNRTAPLYLLQSKSKDEFAGRVVARVKKARIVFRAFDPNETPRLSALDAINQVRQSSAVLLTLISSNIKDHKIHNLRTAFVAGLANGMNKTLLILQQGNEVVPLDLRDYVVSCPRPDSVEKPISEFAGEVFDALQQDEGFISNGQGNLLAKVNLGASAAENEMRTLHNYYLKTDPFLKALRGEVQLVVGRKGSGKTAVFIQIRDTERVKVHNVVLDLMPDGYQLIKFKEQVLRFLESGTMQHTITAFWEYVLLLEICHKVLDNDRSKHYLEDKQRKVYTNLEKLSHAENYVSEGDFFERMSNLMKRIEHNYKNSYGDKENVTLQANEVTGLIYRNDIKKLQNSLYEYLKFKEKIWLLFDNVDKGWPSTGLEVEDLIIIRSLVDAARKLQRSFGRHDIDVLPIIFLRNDVYDLLVKQSSDRQKEAKALLDWTDPDLLKEIIHLRIKSIEEDDEPTRNFDWLWRQICTGHYKGEESFNYLMERSLMRPRFLINLITHCRSFAVNLNQSKIREEDITKGLRSFSFDLLQDINYEIQDIYPQGHEILHAFMSAKPQLSKPKVDEILKQKIDPLHLDKVIELLLWYGFLGILYKDNITYIYTVNYDIAVLKALLNSQSDDQVYCINPAFWPALMIDND